MGKKQPITPISQIKGCFRMLTMRAREVQQVRRECGNTCKHCGKKGSVAKGREVKVQVHHTKKPDWDRIITPIREELLDPRNMECLCTDCHQRVHEIDKSGWRGDYAKSANSLANQQK